MGQTWRDNFEFCYYQEDSELDKMNDGKKGAAAYGYPDSFVQLLGYMKACFHLFHTTVK